jgi:hypothetical protein
MSSAAAVIRRRGGATTWIVIFAAFVALFVVAVVLTRESSTGDTAGKKLSETGIVAVTGDSLSVLPATGKDPAVGASLAEISGESFDGKKVSVSNDGVAKVVLVGAHWCPH